MLRFPGRGGRLDGPLRWLVSSPRGCVTGSAGFEVGVAGFIGARPDHDSVGGGFPVCGGGVDAVCHVLFQVQDHAHGLWVELGRANAENQRILFGACWWPLQEVAPRRCRALGVLGIFQDKRAHVLGYAGQADDQGMRCIFGDQIKIGNQNGFVCKGGNREEERQEQQSDVQKI